jgi:hypothetical protein
VSGTTRRKPGWMGTCIESLRVWLLERGYTSDSIKHVVTLAGQMGRRMEGADVRFSQLGSDGVDSLLSALQARGVRRVRVACGRC